MVKKRLGDEEKLSPKPKPTKPAPKPITVQEGVDPSRIEHKDQAKKEEDKDK